MDPHTVRNAMLLEPVELWRAVRNDAAYVVRQCRALARLNHSAAVRVRLAQLAEYAELSALGCIRHAHSICWQARLR